MYGRFLMFVSLLLIVFITMINVDFSNINIGNIERVCKTPGGLDKYSLAEKWGEE